MSSFSGQRRNTASRNLRRPTTVSSPTPNQQWIPRSSTTTSSISPNQKWVPKSPAVPHIILPDVPQTAQELQDKLSRSAVNCTICFDMVRRSAPIWSCPSCFSIFHLPCIRNLAHISPGDWICPACKTPHSIPARDLSYSCFCGRKRDPPYQDGLTPHSCCNPCGRSLRCSHICPLQCHPGPCPPCSVSISTLKCPCGKTKFDRCCSNRRSPLTCGQPCNRLLRCRRHACERSCHAGACGSCEKLLVADCFCGKKTEAAVCGGDAGIGAAFSCNDVCGRGLLCGNHVCRKICHPGLCGECELLPGSIRDCHCGKTKLVQARSSCLDPIPTCSEICGKLVVSCKSHFCGKRCHEGECPPCSAYVQQRCRCGCELRFVECRQLFDPDFVFICERTCGQKRSCGRHRCGERCCPLSSSDGKEVSGGERDPHPCSLPCRKWLLCGSHTCGMLCHGGQCPPCQVYVLNEVTCACGKTSMSPPVLCGTPAPTCPHPCLVLQTCGHVASHSCHFGDCPPCPLSAKKDMECNQICQSTACSSSPLLESEVNESKCHWLMESNNTLPLGKKKLACETLPRLNSLHFEKGLAMFSVFSDLLARSGSNRFMTVEGSSNSMVLRKLGTGRSFKKKADDARKIEELWKKLFNQAARKPPLIVGLEYSAQIAVFQFPGYHRSMDADRRALVLRIGENCVLVWSNDKNSMSVLSDPAMGTTATRLIDYDSTSPGAVVVAEALDMPAPALPTVGATPWRVVVAPSVDSWRPGRSSLNVWRGNNGIFPPASEPDRSCRLKAVPITESGIGIRIADDEGVEETGTLEKF